MTSSLAGTGGPAEPAQPPPATTATFGTLVFLASDLMLFAGFFAAYFMLRGQTTVWPPTGVHLDVVGASAGTVLLVASSGTMHRATQAFRSGKAGRSRRWLAVTAALGSLFGANQLRDYLTVDFSVSDHAYGGIYWTLTGLHGAHVLTGIALIGLLAWRVTIRPAGAGAAFDSTAYFWHLVDVVWLGLYLVIWILG
jgi:cytochrome c oxidase subunit 3